MSVRDADRLDDDDSAGLDSRRNVMPLDQEVNDLAAGGTVIVQGTRLTVRPTRRRHRPVHGRRRSPVAGAACSGATSAARRPS